MHFGLIRSPQTVSAGARNEGYQSAEAGPSDHCTDRGGLAKSCSRTMMSAKLLRLQTTEEAQAGFGAEQLKVLLNAFFKVSFGASSSFCLMECLMPLSGRYVHRQVRKLAQRPRHHKQFTCSLCWSEIICPFVHFLQISATLCRCPSRSVCPCHAMCSRESRVVVMNISIHQQAGRKRPPWLQEP